MGQFSWITSEGQSIYLRGSSRPTFQVWMVLPDGTKYEEDRYNGYGMFGGKDFYEAVAELNGKTDREDGIDLYFAAEDGERTDVILPRFTRDPTKTWDQLRDPRHCPNQGCCPDDEEEE